MQFFSIVLTLLALAHPLVAALQCAQNTFNNLTLNGGAILAISVAPITNISANLPPTNNFYATNVTGLDVCEVTIQYTHPGQNDTINVVVWLPLGGWNGRFMAIGGGGLATGGGKATLNPPAALGYATAFTDGGHVLDTRSAATWALVSPGNVNWALLQDFASVALDDLATLGKAATEAFYGSSPRYSYWNGCSTGGRQGHMLAQRYPTQFDGILAGAPAFNWASFIVSEYWPQLVMNLLDVYPRQCEFDAITKAATAACDALDGVTDGIVAVPGLCNFDPHTVVGQTFNCSETGMRMQISSEAATVALAAWKGPSTVDGKFEWFGLNPDAPLSGLVNTTCSKGGNCSGVPFAIPVDWIKLFVLKDPTFNLLNLSHREYDTVFRQSNNQFGSIIGTNDPDLTDFRDAGGKMLTWHGLADQLIPPNGTYNYYQRVLNNDPNTVDYYRFYPAPGVGHCSGGSGWFPGNIFQSLVDWVEKDIAPDTVDAKSPPNSKGVVRHVSLCPYPQQLKYTGGDINQASSFICQH